MLHDDFAGDKVKETNKCVYFEKKQQTKINWRSGSQHGVTIIVGHTVRIILQKLENDYSWVSATLRR
ncbi:hypothetical protein Y032_0058g2944 [Ancylostoma ceylanicum]|uniref:Uncharacterized protein n=1 Tax=Ancylostoma ceylanicum TaxID=53326 RepID=A0A016U5B2_9BILA|nr:hypothetical protein Y032_0058g2944 [Ancylostoma ceylanicum]